MPINGYEFHKQVSPATSAQLVQEQKHYYHYLISNFGPERCMFESNFPVDKECVSYRTLWNFFKKISIEMNLSKADKDKVFSETAKLVYRL